MFFNLLIRRNVLRRMIFTAPRRPQVFGRTPVIIRESGPKKVSPLVVATCTGFATIGFGQWFVVARCLQPESLPAEDSFSPSPVAKGDDSGDVPVISIWPKLYEFIRSDVIWFLISVPCALLSTYYNIQINLELGRLLNVIQEGLARVSSDGNEQAAVFRDVLDLVKCSAKNLIGNYVLQSMFSCFYLYSLFVLAERTANRIRMELFSKFLSFEIQFFDLNDSGKILSALSNDVLEFKSSFKQMVSLSIKNLSQVAGSIYVLYQISPGMTLLIHGLAIPGMAVVGSLIGAGLREVSNKLHSQLACITNVAFESLNNIRTVKMLAMEDILKRKFSDELVKFDHLNHVFSFGFAMFQGMTNLAINGIVLMTLFFGGYDLLRGRISSGDLMSFLATTQTLQRSLFQLSLLYGHYIKCTSALQKICSYLALESPDLGGLPPLASMPGEIRFTNVTFRYPKRPDVVVLKDLNLTLESGKISALCGPSGSGKSTIAMLLPALYELDGGSVTLDGVDLQQLDRKMLRRDLIGYISQDPVLFNATIRENILFGKPDATDQEVVAAATVANAHEFIMGFPNGYDTVVGQQGTALSGGQRQRIAIARAMIKDPAILILDEATSALDATSETLVKEALDKVMHGRTVLVIAHRLSTIEQSDIIMVVDRGRIVERGTHQELLNRRGKYYNLVNRIKPGSGRSEED